MDFEVNRQDFSDTRVVEPPPTQLGAGQIRLAVERFALTTNNITYAVAGDMLDYWGFFPTASPAAETSWGRIPVMGLGSVLESAHPDIDVGGRYFGFYPMSSEVVINATPSGSAFRDTSPHRAEHAATYTDFRDVTSDVMFREELADEYLLLRGVFMTSFLVDDSLADDNFHGADQTLVTSASSKTSIALATCLAQRDGHRSIGLTSQRNRAFVERLDIYDHVITYDEIDHLDSDITSGFVDLAGNSAVRAAVHHHFNDRLKYSLTVGATHRGAGGGSERLPGPRPEFFFAPTQSAKRTSDWGADEFSARIARTFHALLDGTNHWLTVEHRTGPDGVEGSYRELLDGQADPSVGYVASINGETLDEPPDSFCAVE